MFGFGLLCFLAGAAMGSVVLWRRGVPRLLWDRALGRLTPVVDSGRASQRRRAITPVEHIMMYMVASSVGGSAAFAAALGQGLAGRPFWVLNAAMHTFLALGVALSVRQVVDISYRSLGHSPPSSLVWGTRAMAVLTMLPQGVVLPIVVLALGDEESPSYDVSAYNLAYVVGQSCMVLMLFCNTPLTYYAATDLIHIIDRVKAERVAAGATTDVTHDLDLAKKRFQTMRVVNVFLWPPLMILIMPVASGAGYAYRWTGLCIISGINLAVAPLGPMSQIFALTRSVAASASSASSSSSKDGSGGDGVGAVAPLTTPSRRRGGFKGLGPSPPKRPQSSSFGRTPWRTRARRPAKSAPRAPERALTRRARRWSRPKQNDCVAQEKVVWSR